MGIPFELLYEAVLFGILLGCFYAAVSMGLSVSFGLLDVPNVAHPAIMVPDPTAFSARGHWDDPSLSGDPIRLLPPRQ